MNIKQKKIKTEPRIKLNYNIYNVQCTTYGSGENRYYFWNFCVNWVQIR